MNEPFQPKVEIDLFEIIQMILNHVKKIIFFALICGGIAAAVAIYTPNTYMSEATLMPVIENENAMNMPGGVSIAAKALSKVGLGANLGSSTGLATKITVVLESKKLAKKVLERIPELNGVYFPELWDAKNKTWKPGIQQPLHIQIVDMLASQIKVEKDLMTEVIKVSVVSKDPVLAKKIIETYLDESKTMLNANTYLLSKKKIDFLTNQLTQNRIAYLQGGKTLSKFYKNKQNLNATGLMQVSIEAPLTSEEGELELPQIVENVPSDVYLNYISSKQQIIESIILGLEQQNMMAQIESRKEEAVFLTVNDPEIPYQKFAPRRTLIVGIGFAAGLFIAALSIVVLEYIKLIRKTKSHSY